MSICYARPAARWLHLGAGAYPDMTEPIDDLLNLTRGILRAVRRYCRDLRASVLDDLGLLAGIEMVIDDCRLPKGARLQVTGRGVPSAGQRASRPASMTNCEPVTYRARSDAR